MREGVERVQRRGEKGGLRPALRAVEDTYDFDYLPGQAINDQEGEVWNHEFASIGPASRPPPLGECSQRIASFVNRQRCPAGLTGAKVFERVIGDMSQIFGGWLRPANSLQ